MRPLNLENGKGNFFLKPNGVFLVSERGARVVASAQYPVKGEKVRFAVYGPRRSMLRRFGAAVAGDALAAVEERALWARFGM